MATKKPVAKVNSNWAVEYAQIDAKAPSPESLINITGTRISFPTKEHIAPQEAVAVKLTSDLAALLLYGKVAMCKIEELEFKVTVEVFWIGWADPKKQQEIAEHILKALRHE